MLSSIVVSLCFAFLGSSFTRENTWAKGKISNTLCTFESNNHWNNFLELRYARGSITSWYKYSANLRTDTEVPNKTNIATIAVEITGATVGGVGGWIGGALIFYEIFWKNKKWAEPGGAAFASLIVGYLAFPSGAAIGTSIAGDVMGEKGSLLKSCLWSYMGLGVSIISACGAWMLQNCGKEIRTDSIRFLAYSGAGILWTISLTAPIAGAVIGYNK